MNRRFWLFISLGLAAAVAAFFTYRHYNPPGPQPPKVILIGMDGLDNLLLDRLIKEGELPNFKKLREGGAWGDLKTIEPILSPIIWNSIATGRDPETHLVYHFLEEDEKGLVRRASSLGRKAPAFWNVAAHYGVSVGSINWYSSWPAEDVGEGFVISDSFSLKAAQSKTDKNMGLTFPTELEPELLSQFTTGKAAKEETLKFVEADPNKMSEFATENLNAFSSMLAELMFIKAITQPLAQRYHPEILATYTKFPDAPSHKTAMFTPPVMSGIELYDAKVLGNAVDTCYVYLDEWLGELLLLMGENTTIIVCSDHGFLADDYKPDTPLHAAHPVGWHRSVGVIMLYGKNVRPNLPLEGATIYDVFPTLCYLSGMPVSAELKGEVLWQAFDIPKAKQKTKHVDDYDEVERDLAAPFIGDGDTESLKEELQALGYVGANEETSEEDALINVRRYTLMNRAYHLMSEGEIEKSEKYFSALFAIENPDKPGMFEFAARVELKNGNLDEAVLYLRKAEEIEPSESIYRLLATIYQRQGQPAKAEEALMQLAELAPYSSDALYLQGMELANNNRIEEALALFYKAADYPSNPENLAVIYNQIGMFEDMLGRPKKAEAAFRNAIAAMPEDVNGYANLGMLYRFEKRYSESLKYLQSAKSKAPMNENLNKDVALAERLAGDSVFAKQFEKQMEATMSKSSARSL